MDDPRPFILMMAGPNGAGKTTCDSHYLPATVPYINADEIAKTLSNEQTRGAEVQAARIALEQMDEAEAHRESFATETTLASKKLASRAVQNFFLLYQPIADHWDVIDNATSSVPRLIATGRLSETDEIHDPTLWNELHRRARDAT